MWILSWWLNKFQLHSSHRKNNFIHKLRRWKDSIIFQKTISKELIIQLHNQVNLKSVLLIYRKVCLELWIKFHWQKNKEMKKKEIVIKTWWNFMRENIKSKSLKAFNTSRWTTNQALLFHQLVILCRQKILKINWVKLLRKTWKIIRDFKRRDRW